ncbi:MAG: monomeric [FeFe] hydrogenase [Marinifilaceae bacterium]|jgi:[FeFe] hydrogenase (group B1/B3)|nr:monomeric [FeFe] hydrogenase [Marinifilaceae bacterium]
MHYNNFAVETRRELLLKLCSLLVNDNLVEKVDRIPLEMRPKEKQAIRCCIHKDRAVLKYKLMAMLGYNIDDEEDELTPLSEYAQGTIERPDSEFTDTLLTVVDEACSACVKVSYTVSNLCRGCEGRPCKMNCPKNAIQMINGQAHIDNDKCISCGLCQKACPYHAIVYMPVPCEEACPVGAITKDENGIEHIDKEKCINCGKCITACPFGAIVEKSHLVHVHESIKNPEVKSVAIVAPAFSGQFKAKAASIIEAIGSLGFDEVFEVAEGADVTIQNETAELVERLEEGHKFMTTSCCPAYTALVDKHIPNLAPMVSDTGSPMVYSAEIARAKYPNAKITFIGPCIAKKLEGLHDPNVDYVLNFEEIQAYLLAKGIDVSSFTTLTLSDTITSGARGFAASGGVTNAIAEVAGDMLNPLVINGIDKKSIAMLKSFPRKAPANNFVEVMSCEGGCIAGPCIVNDPRKAKRQLDTYAKGE